MPIIQSAIKRDRQAQKRRAHNVMVKSDIKRKTKAFRAQIDAKDATKAATALAETIKALDKASMRHILHKNTAARRKSQLTRAYNDIAKKPFGTEATTAKKTASPAKKATTTAKKPATNKTAPAKKPAANSSTTKKS